MQNAVREWPMAARRRLVAAIRSVIGSAGPAGGGFALPITRCEFSSCRARLWRADLLFCRAA